MYSCQIFEMLFKPQMSQMPPRSAWRHLTHLRFKKPEHLHDESEGISSPALDLVAFGMCGSSSREVLLAVGSVVHVHIGAQHHCPFAIVARTERKAP